MRPSRIELACPLLWLVLRIAVMSQSFSCPSGHRWEAKSNTDVTLDPRPKCPQCGAEAVPTTEMGSSFLGAPPTRLSASPMTDPFPTREPSAQAKQRVGKLEVGTQVAGYEILGVLGKGGMGVVYRARHLQLGRIVALKMVLHGAHADAGDEKRFRREAEAIARMQHPHIVQVYEIGEIDGLPFFSLEFCAGGNLAQKLNGAPLPPREAAALLVKLAEAVQSAHGRGILHRDLKPANVLLAGNEDTPLGECVPKIADFGLAKKLDDAGSTGSGALVGTPSYMSPEQASGATSEVTPATDVYALGAILYELLVGRPPFRAASPMETLVQVVSEDPVPPRRLQSKTPRDLETICLKCLRKEPRKRYPTAKALAEDLRRFIAGEPIVARPVGRLERGAKWARRNPAQAALLGVILLALVSLAVLSAGLVVARNDADDKRKQAERQADKAKKARDFLVRIFESAETDMKGGNVTVREMLAEAETKIPSEFAEQPELREDLVAAINKVKRGIGQRTPQAMILEVRGKVELSSAAGKQKAAVPQALLNLDDRLTVSDDAQVEIVFLSDFHKEWVKPGREATIDYNGCEPADAIRERDDRVLMTFVRLPKGTFYMGWNGKSGSARLTEIKEDFEIAVHDVTQGQWQTVMGNNPSWFSRKGGGTGWVKDISDEELKLFPVESVSWDDVQEFLKKLNEREHGRGYLYRLPTEAEWEYACRGGASSEKDCSYHFYFEKPTNDLSSEQANFNGTVPDGKALNGTCLKRTTRVGAYPPNRLGLCDMHGNVAQWMADLFGPGATSQRMFRGGGWDFNGSFCRASSRGSTDDIDRDWLGFRLARVPIH
jgi:formylglycine-generating enzyme required for sulfatase activity